MENNILCEKKEQTVLSNLFEGLSAVLQDCDDADEKEKIKKALQSMTDTTTYIVLGEAQTGKTSLLRILFQDILEISEDSTGDICEYRWGEQQFTTPLTDGFQKKFLTSENMKGLSIIDTKGLNSVNNDVLERISKLVENCDAILVVLDANRVSSSRLWDIIESFPTKRMLFFLAKCDLVSSEELVRNIEKVKCYMKESNISAPIFPISIIEDKVIDGTVSLEDVRVHIRNELIGSNPMLNKQMQNVEEARKLLIQLQDSFSLRKKQYMSDAEILLKINQSMDAYVANHKEMLSDYIGRLAVEINKDIDDYEREIISKLDPYKIKERFRKKEDFEAYLNMVNDNYKTMMTDSVNHKTIEVFKGCLHDLEIIFQEAVGYFNTRENILELNDRFYGSLSKSQKQMVAETKKTIVSTSELYKTLSDASETLFLQIWREREKYDAKIRNRKILSGISGAGTLGTAGGFAGVALGNAVGSTLVSVVACVGLIGIGAIVGIVAVNSIAKTLYDPKAAGKMEEATQKCIEQFKEEVGHTRIRMVEQVSAQITEIFEKELASVDGCFADFRMSVNIDEKKIPVLEQKLLETEKILRQIDTI